ncbi:Inner membrane protein yohK, partial [Dysosmobacter welbionis]
AHEGQRLVPNGVVLRIHHRAGGAFVTDGLCQLHILAFSVPALPGNAFALLGRLNGHAEGHGVGRPACLRFRLLHAMYRGLQQEAQQEPHLVLDLPQADFPAQLLVVVLRADAGRTLHNLEPVPQKGPDHCGLVSHGLRPGLQDEVIHHLLTDAGSVCPQIGVDGQRQIGLLEHILGAPALVSVRVMDPVAFLAVHASWDRTALRINLPIDPERRLRLDDLGPDVCLHQSS